MADFVSSGWSVFIMVVTALSLAACFWLTRTLGKRPAVEKEEETTGHVWDGDLEEYNNPLPRWWIYLFYITIVFAVVYLALYPGFGSNKGGFGWSQIGQYEREVERVNTAVAPLFEKYRAMEFQQVAADPQARAMGERLYLTYCVQCHGSDARGGKGFPNLTDRDWLWGGDPASIEKTILEGRQAMMPAMGAALGGEVDQVAHYVLSLSGSAHDALQAELGKPRFAVCAGCHGSNGAGNQALGAPNLTDRVWLYGGSLAAVTDSIVKGRTNRMPAFGAMLGEDKVRVLAAYIWGLSNATAKSASAR